MGRKQRMKKERNQREKKKKDDVFTIILKSNAFLKSLPSKSDIGRCRCVCKRWRRFLSTPEFNRAHLQYHQVTIDDYKLVVYDPKLPFPFRTFSLNETFLPPVNDDVDIYLKASLNGLVCVALSDKMSDTLVLVNPLTGRCKQLPLMPIRGYSASTDPMGFYIDPAASNNNDYKLLCVPYTGYEGACVYSKRLGSWTCIEFSVPLRHELICWSDATFYRQCLYFCVTRFDSTDTSYTVIRFDVKTETFKEIPIPHNSAYATYHSSAGLVVLEGCLRLHVSYDMTDSSHYVDVWSMNDDDDDEFKKLDTFEQPDQLRHFIHTETIGDWIAVLNQHGNFFEKMTTEEFKTRNLCFYPAFLPDRLIYSQTLVGP